MRLIQVIIFITLVLYGSMQESESEEKSKSALANYKGDRSEPIDISKTFSAGENSALLITRAGEEEEAELINTGYSLELRLKSQATKLVVSGPAVANYLYVFTRVIFNWAKTADGVAGTTIDGKEGAAVELSVLFYNTKYKSYFDALKRRDGILKIRIRVYVKSGDDNKDFAPLAKLLEQLVNPGSVDTTLGDARYLTFPATEFYAYSGSVKNMTTGETYNCSITVVITVRIHISPQQFEKFTSLKGSDNNPLVTAEDQHTVGARPVVYEKEKKFVRLNNSDMKAVTSKLYSENT